MTLSSANLRQGLGERANAGDNLLRVFFQHHAINSPLAVEEDGYSVGESEVRGQVSGHVVSLHTYT